MTLHGPPRRSDGEEPPAPEHAPAGVPPGTLAHGQIGAPGHIGVPGQIGAPGHGAAPGQAVAQPVAGQVVQGQVVPGQNAGQHAAGYGPPVAQPAPGHGPVPVAPGQNSAHARVAAPGQAQAAHAQAQAAYAQAVHAQAQAAPARAAHAAPSPATVTQDPDADSAVTTRMGAPAVVGARGADQATATTAAATAAAAAAVGYSPSAAPAAAPASLVPPRPPETGTVYTGTGGPDGRDRFGQRRTRQSLRIGAHTASDRALELLGMAIPGAGLVLGYDLDQTTASIRLFRPEPTRVALVGGEWACHVIALRALALGARVAVFTTTPERWDGFGEWATGRAGRVATFSLDQSVVVPASAHEPGMLLYDAGLTGVASNVPLGPWQTRLTVLRQLTSYGIPAIQEANMVLAQRLTRAETEVVTSTMRLSSEAGGWMQTLNDDAMAVIVGGEERYVRLTLASLEQQLGAPRR